MFLFKNVNINFMLYVFCTRPYYILCLHFTLTTTCVYAFHFNIIYMYLFLHVFLFKNFNINFMLYLFSCYIYFVREHITQCTYILF